MKCPKCGEPMIAIGGVPTVWKCVKCTREKQLAKERGEALYMGDGAGTLEAV